MSIITKITQQKNDSERYNIFVDEKYAFSVHESVLIKYNLKKGMLLDEWVTEEIAYEDEIEKAFHRALHYLSFRMRSEREVEKKLKEVGFGEAVIKEAIMKLRRLNFLDDEAFSEAFMRTQKNASSKGPRAIQQALQQKGIAKDVQQEVLEMYSEKEQFTIAQQLAQKVVNANENQPPLQVKQKIQNQLLRRGFHFSLIQQVIDSITIERDDEQWSSIAWQIGEKAWVRYARKYAGYELRNRVKQAMYQKGIPMDEIDRFIQLKEEE